MQTKLMMRRLAKCVFIIFAILPLFPDSFGVCASVLVLVCAQFSHTIRGKSKENMYINSLLNIVCHCGMIVGCKR